MDTFKVVDLFCGSGGLSLGCQMASPSFEIIAGVDIIPDFVKSFKYNHSEAISICSDLGKKKIDGVLSKNGIDKKEVDVLIGGPPCQGFSTVGNRLVKDSRNLLVQRFAVAVKGIEPMAFLMENVPGLISMKNEKGQQVIDELIKNFYDLGYRTQVNLLQALEYGVPQNRKRVFFAGFRKDLKTNFHWPPYTHTPKKSLFTYSNKTSFNNYLTVSDAISDLPPLEDGGGDNEIEYPNSYNTPYQKWARKGSNKLTNHVAPKHLPIVKKRISLIPPGGNHSSLPKNLQLKSGYPNIYGRLKYECPASTITANFGCASAPGKFLHPEYNRVLTVREGARLQSFPDKSRFFGSLTSRYKQVGNAVPPLLSRAIFNQIFSALRDAVK